MRSKNDLVNVKPNKKSRGKPERPRSQPKMNPHLRTQSRKSSQKIHQNPSDPQAQQQQVNQYVQKKPKGKVFKKNLANWSSRYGSSSLQPSPLQLLMMQQTKKPTLYEKYRRHLDTLWWAKQNKKNEADINLEDQLTCMLKFYGELRLQLKRNIEKKRQWPQKRKENEAKRRQLEQKLDWTERKQQKIEQQYRQARQIYFQAIQNNDPKKEELNNHKEECGHKYEMQQLKISQIKKDLNKLREEETMMQQLYLRDLAFELEKLDQQGPIISSIQDFVENNSGVLWKKIRARKDQLTKLNAQYKIVEDYLKCSQQEEWPAEEVERLKVSKKALNQKINQKKMELSTLESKLKKAK